MCQSLFVAGFPAPNEIAEIVNHGSKREIHDVLIIVTKYKILTRIFADPT